MKALTIKQPWATLIAQGIKPIENRRWACDYRGPLLIRAGKSKDYLEDYISGIAGAEEFEDDFGVKMTPGVLTNMIYGAIVGVVDLVNILPIERVKGQPYAEGPYCWMMENAVTFEPAIITPGQRSLWDFPAWKIPGHYRR